MPFSRTKLLAIQLRRFARNKVNVLEWPGNSPDLNPIETLWFRLKRIVRERHPTNKPLLIEAIIFAWNSAITQDELVKPVDSMPARCRAVIQARGYPTKY
jgi:transposase